MLLRGFSVELVTIDGSLSRKNTEKILCTSKNHYQITDSTTLTLSLLRSYLYGAPCKA
jgi:hypothetical protein